MFSHYSPDILARAKRIKLLVLDVDGVLTSAQLFMSSNGEIIKAFNTLDGHGIKMLQNSGVQTAIITARNDEAVGARAKQLGITHYFFGVHDKKVAFEQLCEQAGVSAEQCAMVGDDVIDLPVLVRCGLPISVANAHTFVKKHTALTTEKNGGFGAVREVTDLIMQAQNTLLPALNEYLK
ncbi:KdsC family phosphatase [Kingella negevensis]|uniref:3-deoxy-D-manno-octulosonate 8-phosphate phosphatase KdsC n=1 Tax=Kingella negevensis TaxID=1522312 RepID=A0A238HDF1_9NEIS|nr:HAD family hydrolase [Kingella negevensis]MDK4681034.1 HAD family hydrolase [Kingella negevensis]MDK4683236.1 HAD family hydrolase [Kingella negevensis]MDK4683908.1 HAD family hydrolase [Kingella negevensis]MDK4688095.1 HAD family hydrolase [Kingella negevensis]MDK4691632.1 HAD family hydrolase [Kingella negevensis]